MCADRRTGTLTVKDSTEKDSITKRIYFEEGRVVFAASSDPDERLGCLFLRHGMISLKTLREALLTAKTEGTRLGTALVRMKAIRPEDLVWGVCEQVSGMVASLFCWTHGAYAFQAGPLQSEEVITLKMSTGDLVMKGIKSIESWPRINSAIGNLETRYVTTERFEEVARLITLNPDEWTLLTRCETGATLSQICEEYSMKDFDICRLVWAFMVVGLLQTSSATMTAGAGQ
jgi:hypothetical protein